MAENKLNVRLQQKYATYDVWQASSLVLKSGELAICSIPSGDSTGLTPPAIGIKVGDGTKTFSELNWIQSTAGDVYAWAKAANKPAYTADEIGGLAEYISGEVQDTDTTYTFTQTGNVLTIKKADKGGEYVDYATFDMSALATRVSELETKVGTDTVVNQIDAKIAALDLANTYETKENAATTKTSLEETIAANKTEAATYTDTKTQAITDTIGEVTEGKTVVEMIDDAKTSATYDDTALAARVTANEESLTTLKAGAETEGSVDYKIAQAVAAIMENPDETMNSINELVTWINDHAADALELNNLAQGNADDIAALELLVGETAVATQITDAIAAALKVDGVDKYALASDLTAAIARVAALEAKSHEHANAEVLDGITSEKVAAWDSHQVNVIESVVVGGVTATVADKVATIAQIPTSALVDDADSANVLILDCGGAE